MKQWQVLLLLLLLLPAQGVFAQRCISQERLEEHLLRYPAAQKERLRLEDFIRQWTEAAPTSIGFRNVVVIPVVFHIVWNLPQDNISDEQIQSQLIAINKDFRLLNNVNGLIPAMFQPLAADMELTFCLAQRAPDGTTTTGVVRTATNLPFIGNRIAAGRKTICHTADGGSDSWPTDRYVNIWVGRRQFFPAEASFPGAAVPGEDGIIIDPRFIGTTGTAATNQPYHLGRTLTHEMGHYFNLYHLWGPGQPGGCIQSDEVADTPIQSKTYLGECPTHPQFTCGTTDMFMNFMNYTDDACMAMFSLGQKVRVLAAIAGFRPGLLLSDGCMPPVSTIDPAAQDYIRVAGNPTTGGEIRLHMRGFNGRELRWRLFNVSGAPLRQGRLIGAEEAAVDAAGLPAGVYVLQISDTALLLTQKILLLH